MRLTLSLGTPPCRPCHWQLNNFLLQHLPSKSELESTLKLYFGENDTPDVSLSALWEAHKAVLHGHCIAISSAMKKNAWAVKLQTEKERQLQTTPSLLLLKKIVRLCTTLRDLALGRVEKALISLKQLYYDKGNKAHSPLARKMRDRTHITAPHQIQDGSGGVLSHPRDVIRAFEEFLLIYRNNPEIPHVPPSSELQDHMRQYLEQSVIPHLQASDLHSLNAPITKEELKITYKSLPSHEAPGPDGFHYEYYRTFLPLLLPHTCKIFNAFLQDTPIPSGMQRSFITLIPKPDKDPSLCENLH